MKRLYLWWNNRQQNSDSKETDMAKRRSQKNKQKSGVSPYVRHRKQPYFYGEGYKENYLVNGVLYRNGKPHRFSDKSLEPKSAMLQAAE